MLNLLPIHASYMPSAYSNIKIPEELAALVEKVISENKQLGYRNRSEFIIEAIREKIRSLENREKKT